MPTLKSFHDIAQDLGHDVINLKPGEAVSSTITVENFQQLKDLLKDTATPAMRTERTRSMFERFPDASDPTDISAAGTLHRVEAAVYGDHALSADDEARIASVFPMSVNCVSIKEKTLAPGEQWNLTAPDPVCLNIGQLTMEAGSSIIIRSTVLDLTIGTLIRNGGDHPGPGYDLGILGATGDTGKTGDTGPNGSVGGPGNPGWCSSVGIVGGAGQPGGTGTKGITGGNGGPGGPGKPSQSATITISGGITGSLAKFVIYTKSGTGGAGGAGGTGGNGGRGGTGGAGVTCDCTGSGAGNGGRGGTAGRGGTGGLGAPAADGSTIYVNVPKGLFKSIIKQPGPSVPPGLGGRGGLPGTAGRGGTGGVGGKNNGNASPGGTGPGAVAGVTGPDGTYYGKPADIKIDEH
jgi:hypothetical protein